MESTCLDILDLIAECYLKYLKDKAPALRKEIQEQTALMCGVFEFRVKGGAMLKVSEQQQHDLRFELQRLHAVVQLARLTAHETYAAARTLDPVRKRYAAATAAVFSNTRFDEAAAMRELTLLQDAMKLAGVVTKRERDMLVKAMNMKAGAWYKCPNGHPYCIADCGGAMEESKCPCGAKIGGRNHTLTAGNSHAGEMDGSRFPAWSEGYNNMANFDLQNL